MTFDVPKDHAVAQAAARVSNQETKRKSSTLPLPPDGPLLSFADVAAYLRLTPAAVRKLVDGRADGSDGELGELLRRWLVRLSPHRRYISRTPFFAWLERKPVDEKGSGHRLK
jgi:hypothetical protein